MLRMSADENLFFMKIVTWLYNQKSIQQPSRYNTPPPFKINELANIFKARVKFLSTNEHSESFRSVHLTS